MGIYGNVLFHLNSIFIQTFKQKTKTIGTTNATEYYLLIWKPCSHIEVYTQQICSVFCFMYAN